MLTPNFSLFLQGEGVSTFHSKIHFIIFHFIQGEGGYKGRKYRFQFLLCFFSRKSNSTTTNVRQFVCPSVSQSVNKTPQQLKINDFTLPLPSPPFTPSKTPSPNITHNITTQHHASQTTSNTSSSHIHHHPHNLALERLLSFSACFLKASLMIIKFKIPLSALLGLLSFVHLCTAGGRRGGGGGGGGTQVLAPDINLFSFLPFSTSPLQVFRQQSLFFLSNVQNSHLIWFLHDL